MGKTLIVAESLAARPTAFDIEPDGSLTNRRTRAELDDRDFESHDLGRTFPDGICLDAEGAVWVALPWGDVGVHRVIENNFDIGDNLEFFNRIGQKRSFMLPAYFSNSQKKVSGCKTNGIRKNINK